MNRRQELMNEVDKLENEMQALSARKATAIAELVKELGSSPSVTVTAAPPAEEPAKGQKRGRKPASEKKFPSLKKIVKDMLAKSKDGMELQDIVTEVKGMISRKEYESSATNLSAVVSQATTSLKAEGFICQDKESRKYTAAPSAA